MCIVKSKKSYTGNDYIKHELEIVLDCSYGGYQNISTCINESVKRQYKHVNRGGLVRGIYLIIKHGVM